MSNISKLEFKDGSISFHSLIMGRPVRFWHEQDREGIYKVTLHPQENPIIKIKHLHKKILSEIINYLISQEYNQLLKEK
jgi:hypothetical protein